MKIKRVLASVLVVTAVASCALEVEEPEVEETSDQESAVAADDADDLVCGSTTCTCVPKAGEACPAGCVSSPFNNNCQQNGSTCNANSNGDACTYKCVSNIGGKCPNWVAPNANGSKDGKCDFVSATCASDADEAEPL